MSNEALGIAVSQILRTKQAGKRAGRLIDHLYTEREALQGALDKWQKKFEDHPSYAFSWSAGAFENAAELLIVGEMIRVFESEEREDPLPPRVADMIVWLKREVMHNARYPAQSSSTQHNLDKLATLRAKAIWLENLEEVIDDLIEEQDELDAQGGA